MPIDLLHSIAERSTRLKRRAWYWLGSTAWGAKLLEWLRRDAVRTLGAGLLILKNQPLRIAEEIGRKFLKSEARLEELTNASQELVSRSESLIELATGQASGRVTVEETLALLKAPLEYLDRWHSDMEHNLGALESASRVLSQLSNSEAILQCTVKPLLFTQTMFRTESAKLPESSRGVFASLSAEIDSVQSRVRDTFWERFRLVANTQRSIDEVIRGVREQSRHLEQTLRITKVHIAESASNLLIEIDRNATRDVKLTHTSAAIATEVGRIVVALQTHDIVSQRLAHAATAIEENAAKLAPGRSIPTTARDLQGVHASIQVQSAQIVQVNRMLSATEETLHRSASAILERSEVLDHECLLLQEFKEVSAAANGTIQILLEMIGDVRALTGSALRVAMYSSERIDPIGALASQLTGSVERLSHEMRLIALNAEIQAVQIGQGTGLEVLAAHTSGVSSATSRLADKLSSDLQRLGEDLGGIVESFRSLTHAGLAQASVLEKRGAVQEAKLHEHRDEILGMLQKVGGNSDQMRALAAAFIAEAAVRAASEPLEKLATELDSSAAELLTIAPNLSAAKADLGIAGAYTMKGEREIYSSVMERLSGKSEIENHREPDEIRPESAAAVELF